MLDKDVAHEVEDESSTPKQSKLRRVNVSLLADEDNRYSGKRISRKSLEGSTRGKFPGGKLKYFKSVTFIQERIHDSPSGRGRQPHI